MSASRKRKELKVYDRNGTRIRKGDLIQPVNSPILFGDKADPPISSPAIVVGFGMVDHHVHLVYAIGRDGLVSLSKSDVEILKKCFK